MMTLNSEEIIPILEALQDYFERSEDLITDLTLENEKMSDLLSQYDKKGNKL